jgi:hypothetical protein
MAMTMHWCNAFPNAACPELPKKPLDTAIGQVSPRIAPADDMIINFGIKDQVVAL